MSQNRDSLSTCIKMINLVFQTLQNKRVTHGAIAFFHLVILWPIHRVNTNLQGRDPIFIVTNLSADISVHLSFSVWHFCWPTRNFAKLMQYSRVGNSMQYGCIVFSFLMLTLVKSNQIAIRVMTSIWLLGQVQFSGIAITFFEWQWEMKHCHICNMFHDIPSTPRWCYFLISLWCLEMIPKNCSHKSPSWQVGI